MLTQTKLLLLGLGYDQFYPQDSSVTRTVLSPGHQIVTVRVGIWFMGPKSNPRQFCDRATLWQFCDRSSLLQFCDRSTLGQFCDRSTLGQFCDSGVLWPFCNMTVLWPFCYLTVLWPDSSVTVLLPDRSVTWQFCNRSVTWQFYPPGSNAIASVRLSVLLFSLYLWNSTTENIVLLLLIVKN